jgi:hypothetical protein
LLNLGWPLSISQTLELPEKTLQSSLCYCNIIYK